MPEEIIGCLFIDGCPNCGYSHGHTKIDSEKRKEIGVFCDNCGVNVSAIWEEWEKTATKEELETKALYITPHISL